MKRLFLAIPIPGEIKSEVQKHIKQFNLPLNWIPPKNLHVTLHFFGNTEETSMGHLIQTIREVCQHTSPFILEASSIGVASGKFQHMVWVRFEESTGFETLAIEISRRIGINKIRKPLPHINLARSKEKIKSTHLPLSLKSLLKIKVGSIELWESKLSLKGSTYFALESFTLMGE